MALLKNRPVKIALKPTSYATLPDQFYTRIAPTPVKAPALVIVNHALADTLGLSLHEIDTDDLAQLFSGNLLPEGSSPVAQAYAGHQFGHFTMLGDGRAHLIGELIAKGGYRQLIIPAIAEEDETYQLSHKSFYERAAGEPLHEGREDIDTLNEIRSNIGSLNFYGQYQQAPVPPQGRMFKREWIRYWDTVERSEGIEFWSWDTAITSESHSDYSVGTHWLAKKNGYFLIDLVRERLEFNALRAKILGCASRSNCSTVLIERSPCSLGVAQSLTNHGLNLISIPAKDGKQARAMRHVAAFEAGRVYFRKDAAWLPDLLNELLAFPASKHDDQVDSITQAITWAEHKLLINVPIIHGRMTWIGNGLPMRTITF